jgi:hypothetical protein
MNISRLVNNKRDSKQIHKPETESDVKYDNSSIEIELFDEIPKCKIKPISEVDNLRKLKLYDDIDNKIIEIDDVILLINGKPKLVSDDLIIMDFPEHQLDSVKGNKNTLYLRYKITDNIFSNQYITNRFIVMSFTYIDDDKYICLLLKKDSSNKYRNILKQSGSKSLTISPTIDKLKININDLNTKLDYKAVDYINTYNYINFNVLTDCNTYLDVFQKARKLYSKTIDLNYIKVLDELTRDIYEFYKNRNEVER